jgi:hypothetical protein
MKSMKFTLLAVEDVKAHSGNFVEPTTASAWNAPDSRQNREER